MPQTLTERAGATFLRDYYGAVVTEKGVEFSLYSEHATAITVCLFDRNGQEFMQMPLEPDRKGNWAVEIEGVEPGQRYGYRVDGPYEPWNGHRFNKNKLLIDPYARAVDGDLIENAAIYGYIFETKDPDTFDTRDSAPYVPKSVVVGPLKAPAPLPEIKPERRQIYEGHVTSLTKLKPEIPEIHKGKLLGMAEPGLIRHFRKMRFSHIELLPLAYSADEPHLTSQGKINYWGYNTLAPFAPAPRYRASANPEDAPAEVQYVTAAYANAGMQLILDSQNNHTAEGNEFGPTLSLKGIDNRNFYSLNKDNLRWYYNDTGCGNTINIGHPFITKMTADVVDWWTNSLGMGGVRFDLARTLTRDADDIQQSAFIRTMATDQRLQGKLLIAEPWDVGPGGLATGQFRGKWLEWNGFFRDDTKMFWRGDDGRLPAMSRAMSGSPDHFHSHDYQAGGSVNAVFMHDGNRAKDATMYDKKRNWANGEENRDGNDHNYARVFGPEGPSDDPVINDVRYRQMRNYLATSLMARGTPMILGGDELGHSQHGNNNAYCQDNDINHFNWAGMTPDDKKLVDFVSRVASVRHAYDVLHDQRFMEADKVQWLSPDGHRMNIRDWHRADGHCFGYLLSPDQPASGPGAQKVMVMMNAWQGDVPFKMPAVDPGHEWIRLFDTANPEASGLLKNRDVDGQDDHAYRMAAHSMVVLAQRPKPEFRCKPSQPVMKRAM